MSFETLGLTPEICTAVNELGYTKATPVQKKVIPLVLDGKDIMATAQTGTGKTAAYALPILQLLSKKEIKEKTIRVIRSLVLVPTRELAAQVGKSIEAYGKNYNLKSCAVYGGVKFTPQTKKLERGIDILVATPGRLLEHIKQDNVDLSHVEIVVFDESDRILDMGFWEEIVTLSNMLPKKRQTLLFSVEHNKSLKRFSELTVIKPVKIDINNQGDLAKKVRQTIYVCDENKKSALLSYMIGSRNWHQVLVFTKTKKSADEVGAYLEDSGLKTLILHGDKAHSKRTKALKDFKAGTIRVLVATDIASRGLDIEELPHVINYELPGDAEDYIHRIGRTGRAGNEGEAISLVCKEEKSVLKDIERLLKYGLKVEFFEGFEPKDWVEKEARKHTLRGKIERSQEKRSKTANNVAGMRKKKANDRNAQKKATLRKRKKK
ncbi:DEAD/DEAH box helicase [Sulfurospirillum arcachonense]|uniref:DEAD/DEAH box helicase n=1 Tax=Sulfurospirillum arcachonense TaxID=57666 RepID=UPI00046922F5|nr:DEAD/DEAH box helicase [Sulfurospirillum arcachonense]